MESVLVDLKSRTLPADHAVYMVRPGNGYHLYDEVLKTSAIPADVPFLEVEDGVKPSQAANLDAQLERAREIRRWERTPGFRRERRPTLDLERYSIQSADAAAARTRLLNAAEDILSRLPAHALVFIPAASLSGDALTAELAPPMAARKSIEATVHGQRVQYVGRPLLGLQRFPMRHLPPSVTDEAKLRLAIFKYSGYARERLLRAHYGDFQLGTDRSMMELVARADRFNTSSVARLTAAANSIDMFLQTGNFVSLGEAALIDVPGGSAQIHARINSSGGRLQVESFNKVAHILKVLVLVAVGGISGAVLYASAQTGSIQVWNSEALTDQGAVEATERGVANFALAAGAAGGIEEIVESLRATMLELQGEVDGSAVVR